ncbi:MAG: hypothetical protein ABIG89_05915, partial [Candidatus Woesearchaeota archaeon]
LSVHIKIDFTDEEITAIDKAVNDYIDDYESLVERIKEILRLKQQDFKCEIGSCIDETDVPEGVVEGELEEKVGVVLRKEQEQKKREVEKYYKNRVRELFNPNFSGQDVWVSRWELDGILHFIINGKDGKGRHYYPNFEFEHGTNALAMHPYGFHKVLHMYVKVTDMYDNRIKRNFYITDDPNDFRINTIGFDLISGKKIYSKVYSLLHPTVKDQIYKRQIIITYEK